MRRLAVFLTLAGCAWAAPPGLPNSDYPVHALTHAKIYVTSDRVLEDATLILENGKIHQVGVQLEAPPGARIWNCRGKVVHAGFIEPFLGDKEAGNEASEDKSEASGRGDELRAAGSGNDEKSEDDKPPALAAEREVQKDFTLSSERMDKLRGLGILTFQVVPQKGILRGQGAIYTLKSDKLEQDLLKTSTCQVIGLRSLKGQPQAEDFPSSLMGNLSLIRQSFRKARWAAVQQPTGASPSWAALEKARAQNLNFYFEGRNLLEGDSLKRLLDKVENLPLIWVTTPDAVLQPDWLGGRLILTLDYPKLELHAARRPDISYAQAASWRSAPALGKQLAAKNLPFCISVHRLDKWENYPERLLQIKNYGLSEAELLDALTRRPAQWLGLSHLGTLEVGKSATLVVRNGGPFEGTIEQVWVEGIPRRISADHQHKIKAAKLPQSPAYEAEARWQPNGSVLIRNATVWTQGPQGKLENCDVLIQGGKITGLGANLNAPGVTVVDGQSRHLLPGIIDAHSHTAILGDVNEDTENVTAQVDIADVLQPLDPQILNQLAGGVTCAHVLHGSANAIGGRTVTVKWRWGARAEQLPLAGALPGIKFALGENPKQSNWGDAYTSRYPQTRLGVAALIRQRFQEARKYRQLPHPEPDEALETLLEILDGKRLVHCHSYRQDEILMLLRLAEEMHFKIATLQHGLEAYKVADQIAAHGAGVSTFSDWWAYKLEVRDAIPYNGPILKERGVTVSYNSDSDELARRLLGEAAKAVRYGGLSEQEALDFLTINPARQLKIDHRVGSLEIGKDGDCALWSGPPFAPDSFCLRTWVDGTQVFERESYRKRQTDMRLKRQQWLDEAAKKDEK
ncbi:MAG: amidohydrolase family protein [Candidatus Eremiobacteraeota bacterium]|nr:amidohydrolase family protein [Candidatus Eremiobacteraeota bacterium]MCW5865804.1 amidohydrolase family protein [Candidatus Eremiobacteraeota bacterium]